MMLIMAHQCALIALRVVILARREAIINQDNRASLQAKCQTADQGRGCWAKFAEIAYR